MKDVCSLIWLALIGLFRSRASLQAEILTLRHQLNVLRRKSPQRLIFTSIDRLVFAGLYRLAPGVLDALKIVRPETVIRWHRAGFRAYWRWKSRPRGGRPKTPLEIRQLIREISLANPLWGAPRIHGELLKLGIDVGQTTVAKYMARGRRPRSQGWKTFLHNHADGIASMDLFVVPTISFRLLYGLLILHHDRRQILWLGVTAHPTAEWISRQLTEAYGWKVEPRYIIRDRDAVYGDVFIRRLRAMGIRDRPTALRSPWQNGYCERAIGSIRRECLDHVVVFGSGISAICCDLTRPTITRLARCTLLVFIDDATSRLMHLQFVESESTFDYFAATRAYLERYGKPVALYSDKHGVFRVNRKDAIGGDGLTQFGRALHALNIDIICANSSQAKGRVERANGTLQDRLVKEMRLSGIDSIAAGNAFLPAFMEQYNARFAKAPLEDRDVHRPLAGHDDLDDAFAWKEERTVSMNLTLQYDQVLFILEPTGIARSLARKRVTVIDYPDGRLAIRHNGVDLPYRTFDKRPQVNQAAIVENKRLGPILAYIAEQQKKLDMSRSAKAPRRRGQKNHMFKVG